MSNDQLISLFCSFFNDRNLGTIEGILEENAAFYFPKVNPIFGKSQIIRFFKILFRQFPELNFQFHRKIKDGQMAALHWTNRGVSRDGKSYENEGITMLEMEGGRIKFISDFFKDTEKF